MPRLVFREVELWRAGGAAGVAIRHRGETLCIDAPSAEGCRHLFYTHSHPSHYPGGVQEFYSPFGGRLVKPGDVLEVGLFVIHVVDAYNITKLRGGKPAHPRGEGVGYVVEAGGVRIYHTGDTDLIREMASAAPIDILILPIGGETVMTPEEAADAVMLLRPKIAIPIHYSHQKQYVKFRDIAHPYTNIIAL
jgi:hypothetical protein